MTRGNINYIYQNRGEAPTTLYFYWNGDQYPSGIRDFYNVLDFINSDWSIDAFKKWAHDNYEGTVPKTIKQPRVYYTDGFITDYSYIFDCTNKEVKIWNWDKLIFTGDIKKFKRWIQKQK